MHKQKQKQNSARQTVIEAAIIRLWLPSCIFCIKPYSEICNICMSCTVQRTDTTEHHGSISSRLHLHILADDDADGGGDWCCSGCICSTAFLAATGRHLSDRTRTSAPAVQCAMAALGHILIYVSNSNYQPTANARAFQRNI